MNIDQVNRQIARMIRAGFSTDQVDSWLVSNKIDPDALAAENKRLREVGAGDIAREVGQGLSFSFGDELEAAIRSLGGADYKKTRDEIRKRMGEFSQYNPGIAAGSQLAGAALPAIATLGASAPATGGLNAIARGMAYGTAGGALEGAGAAPEVADIPGYAGTGAVIGGALGGAIPVATTGVARLGEALGNLGREAVSNNPASAAGRRISRALEADQLTPGDVASRMAELGPESIAGEAAGPSVMRLGNVAAQRRGQHIAELGRRLDERARSQQGRLTEDLNRETGVNTNFYDDFRSLDNQLRTNAAADYRAAYAKDIGLNATLEELLLRPDVSDAWKRARRSAANQGRQLPEYFTYDQNGDITGVIQTPDMEAWDWIKQGLDARIEANTDSLTGKVNRAGRDTLGLKHDILKVIDRMNPEYATARNRYSGTESLKTAMNLGRKILKDDYEITKEMVDNMTQSERTAYIRGAARAIQDKILAAGEGDAVARKAVFKSPLYRQRLRPAFPDEASYERFMESMKREETFQNTRNILFRGSQSAERLQGTMDEGMDPSVIADVASGGASGIVNAGLQYFKKFMGPSFTDEQANEVIRILGSTDPAELSRALQSGTMSPLWRSIATALRVGTAHGRPAVQGYVGGRLPGLMYQENPE